MADADKREVKKYVTPVFRGSFPAVFEAQSYDDGEPKFGIAAVWTPAKFTEKEKDQWRTIMAALDEESQRVFKTKWKELPANVKRGIRDGAEKADLEGYGEGTRFANLTSKMRPGIVGPDGKTKIALDEGNASEVYPGAYFRATVTIYSYNKKGKGISLGLNNLQKVADGERLDSRTDAAEDFAGTPVDSSYAQKPKDGDDDF